MRRAHSEINPISLSLDITNKNIPHKTLLKEVWHLKWFPYFIFLQVAWKKQFKQSICQEFYHKSKLNFT